MAEPGKTLPPDVAAALSRGNVIEAIKLLRTKHTVGLAEARALLEALQKQAQGYVVPDSFTHGTSAQRVRWFKRGLETGQVSACNTFDARSL